MHKRLALAVGSLFAAASFAACANDGLAKAATDPGQWPMYGRNYDNNRYSPLNQINTGNVDKLKLAYTLQLGALRSNESTPIVIPSRTVVPAWTSQRRRGGARGPDTTIMASVLQALHRIGVEPDREHG
jgi:hypothetical protein